MPEFHKYKGAYSKSEFIIIFGDVLFPFISQEPEMQNHLSTFMLNYLL